LIFSILQILEIQATILGQLRIQQFQAMPDIGQARRTVFPLTVAFHFSGLGAAYAIVFYFTNDGAFVGLQETHPEVARLGFVHQAVPYCILDMRVDKYAGNTDYLGPQGRRLLPVCYLSEVNKPLPIKISSKQIA